MTYENKVLQAVRETMNAHLVLASKYESAGNCNGAVRLREYANMLGAMLSDPEGPVFTILPDKKVEDLKPQPDGFDAWWDYIKDDADSLVELAENGLRDAVHAAWTTGQDQLLRSQSATARCAVYRTTVDHRDLEGYEIFSWDPETSCVFLIDLTEQENIFYVVNKNEVKRGSRSEGLMARRKAAPVPYRVEEQTK